MAFSMYEREGINAASRVGEYWDLVFVPEMMVGI
jgi:hypothetical protein